MEQIFEGLGTGLGQLVGVLADTGVLFAVFAVLWVAFAVALFRSQGTLDLAWRRLRALPLVLQLLVWLLFLPVMIGLWIWQSKWPVVARLVIVITLAAWNLLVFLPVASQAAP